MPDSNPADGANEDLKAKMREALERKQSNDRGVLHPDRDRGHAESHGPAVSKREHRRKAGGGGA
jgi:hypothetical protein